jgi:hypothetical protein
LDPLNGPILETVLRQNLVSVRSEEEREESKQVEQEGDYRAEILAGSACGVEESVRQRRGKCGVSSITNCRLDVLPKGVIVSDFLSGMGLGQPVDVQGLSPIA